jgi:hypothetical protein
MRKNSLFFSLLDLCITAGLISAGTFLIALSLVPRVEMVVSSFFSDHPELPLLFGIIMLSLGIFLFIAFYARNRGQYYTVNMSPHEVTIDTSIIRTYAEIYWQTHFPGDKTQIEVLLHKNQKIELIAEMPNVPFESQRLFLERAERELGVILAEKFSYQRAFLVTFVTK